MSKRVLLLTNSVLTREVLVGPLGEHGYEVLLAEDPWEAIGACRGKGVDLLLVDLDWSEDGGWNGWELIRGALGARPSLPVVLITGRLDLVGAARAAGVSALAEKPVDVSTLVEVAGGLVEEQLGPGGRSNVPRVRQFERIPADGEALRAAIEERCQRPFLASQPYRHWGLNE